MNLEGLPRQMEGPGGSPSTKNVLIRPRNKKGRGNDLSLLWLMPGGGLNHLITWLFFNYQHL